MRFIVPDVFTVGIICPDILITTYGASVPSDQSSTGCEQVGHTTLQTTGYTVVPIFILARTIRVLDLTIMQHAGAQMTRTSASVF